MQLIWYSSPCTSKLKIRLSFPCLPLLPHDWCLAFHTFLFPNDHSSRTKTIHLTCFVFHSFFRGMPCLAFTLPQKNMFFRLSSRYMKSWQMYSSRQLSVQCWYHYEHQSLLLSRTYFYVTLVTWLTFENHSQQHYFLYYFPLVCLWISNVSVTG